MVCSGIRFWTFSGLVVAFLDLGVAYILLCASALAFLASKILGLFGLNLPCTCDGLLSNYDRNICVQRLLIDCSLEKIYSARSAIDYPTPVEINTVKKRKDYGSFKYQGDMYSSSYLDGSFRDKFVEESGLKSEFSSGSGVMKLSDMKDEKFDLGTTERGSLMPRHNLRYRSQFVPVSEKFLWMTPESDAQIQNEGHAPICTGFLGRDLEGDDDIRDRVHEGKTRVQRSLSFEEQWCDGQRKRCSKSNEKDMISMMEEALKEEHAARAALHLELEKERSAAATAADEAMAMILRLQEEKANIEMEAMQYRRMVEEKSVYEAEEMNILREILMREKHCLENENEAYRHMISGKRCLSSEMQDMPPSQIEIAENLMFTAEQIGRPDVSEEDVKAAASGDHTLSLDELFFPETGEDADSWSKWNTDMHRSASEDCHHFSDNIDELPVDFQEKGILAADGNEFSQQRDIWVPSKSYYPHSQGPNIEHKTEQNDGSSLWKGSTSKAIKIDDDEQIHFPGSGGFMKKQRKELEDEDSSEYDLEPSFLDVHVIDDAVVMHDGARAGNIKQSTSFIPKMATKCYSPALSMSKSCSNITCGPMPVDYSQLQRSTILSDKNRGFMNAVDYERSRIENEVKWLFNRLRILQENREKLIFSARKNNKG